MGRERLLLDRAQVVVALDHDVIGPGPFQTFHARGWGLRRRAFQAGDGDALLFVAEPSPTITGVTATERLAMREDRIGALLTALGERVGLGVQPPALTSLERGWADRAALTLGRPGWNHGIVGIVAGRLAEQYQKPVIVVGFDGDVGRGSVRGPAGARLFDALSAVSASLVRFGGHQAAAGVEVEYAKLDELRQGFEAACARGLASVQGVQSAGAEVIELLPEDDPRRVFADMLRLARDVQRVGQPRAGQQAEGLLLERVHPRGHAAGVGRAAEAVESP